jgi:uncharacterized surface protein with fasciclin (FAS1) repeats
MIQDGMTLNQVNGSNVKFVKAGDQLTVNEAAIAGAAPASNGLIYVIDQVLLPPGK